MLAESNSPLLALGQACAKCILFGEHFVVHGGPALALPVQALSTRVKVLHRGGGGGCSLQCTVPAEDVLRAEQILHRALELLALDQDIPPWDLVVESTIPLGAGLGSSAAFAVALLRALALALPRPLPQSEINTLAYALEEITHGTPSGIDNTVISHARPLWFVTRRQIELLTPGRELCFLLATSSEPRRTSEAVARVHANRARYPDRFTALLDQARRLAEEGRQAFLAGERKPLGVLLDQTHVLLQQIGVSTPRLDALVATARQAGALGAKLTGAGMGGFIVALLPGPELTSTVSQALQEHGATAMYSWSICEESRR